MLLPKFILVRALCGMACVLGLVACGQKGPLFLPTSPAAAQRSSLPETLRPDLPGLPGARPGATAPAPQAPASTPGAAASPAPAR